MTDMIKFLPILFLFSCATSEAVIEPVNPEWEEASSIIFYKSKVSGNIRPKWKIGGVSREEMESILLMEIETIIPVIQPERKESKKFKTD